MPTRLPLALADADPGFDPLAIWRQVSLFNRGIIILLGLLLLLQVYIAVERGILYLQSEAATRRFLGGFLEALRRGDLEGARRACADQERSHVALVLRHGLDIFQYERSLGPEGGGGRDPIPPVERAVARGAAEVAELLQKGMLSLASIGSLAPFIGLLGTVVGIIKVFSDLKARGAGDINALAGSIGESLATTALGLICAIPAVWIYNFYTSRQEQVASRIQNAASRMIDEFIRLQSRGGAGMERSG
jgi:biopolymer transport protein ExbB/biopolymer transport protein TolQ